MVNCEKSLTLEKDLRTPNLLVVRSCKLYDEVIIDWCQSYNNTIRTRV